MAYNTTETEIAEIKKNERGEYIKVKKIEGSNKSVSIDARIYYTSDSDEILPTKKGIRISSELAVEVLTAMAQVLEDSDLQDLRENLNSMLSDRGLD